MADICAVGIRPRHKCISGPENQKYHGQLRENADSRTALSGSKYFPSIVVEEAVEDPWQPGVGSKDPWKLSTQAPPTAQAPKPDRLSAQQFQDSPTVVYQIDSVSAQLEEQHRAYLATRIDLAQLFQSDGSREVPPPTDEPGVAKPVETAEYAIGTPVQSRSPGWRRRRDGSDSLSSSSPPVRGKRPATADVATSPIRPHLLKHVHDFSEVQSHTVPIVSKSIISEDEEGIFHGSESLSQTTGSFLEENIGRHGGRFSGNISEHVFAGSSHEQISNQREGNGGSFSMPRKHILDSADSQVSHVRVSESEVIHASELEVVKSSVSQAEVMKQDFHMNCHHIPLNVKIPIHDSFMTRHTTTNNNNNDVTSIHLAWPQCHKHKQATAPARL